MQRTKYNIDKNIDVRTFDGIKFDSELEMRYYRDVIVPSVKDGSIKKVELQKSYVLQPKFCKEGKTVLAITYKIDFCIEYKDGSVEVVDTKGCPDDKSKIKRKMFLYKYPYIPLRWISYCKKYGGWIEYDDLQKLRRENKKEKKESK